MTWLLLTILDAINIDLAPTTIIISGHDLTH